MKILMLVNWKVDFNNENTKRQSGGYFNTGELYWFFKYFKDKHSIDVVDIRSCKKIEKFEKNVLKFYVIQTLRILPKLNKYDLIISHGAQSAILLSFLRRIIKMRNNKHIVFDIGSFNSAKESGALVKLNQWASKSIDAVIYHTSSQLGFYEKIYPWIAEKAYFLKYGTDVEYFEKRLQTCLKTIEDKYILCLGYSKRDWKTLIKAFDMLDTDYKLMLIGNDKIVSDNKNIIIKGFISAESMVTYIKNAEFCVLPLKDFNYSFGQMTLLQQMLCGKAVITADVPSIRDYIIKDYTAIVYQAENVVDLKEKIKFLIDNPKIRTELALHARKSVIDDYSEKRMAKDIETVIHELMGY